jgi:hypothetical protein
MGLSASDIPRAFIGFKRKNCDSRLWEELRREKAEGTLFWVASVCKSFEKYCAYTLKALTINGLSCARLVGEPSFHRLIIRTLAL